MKVKKRLLVFVILLMFTPSLAMISVLTQGPIGPYVKVYVDQPGGGIPGVPVGQKVTVDIIIEVSGIPYQSPDSIIGWGIYVQVDPDVLNITRAKGAVPGYFLYNFADDKGLPYPSLLSSLDATTGFGDLTEQIMPPPLYGADDWYSGLKLVTIEFISKSGTAFSLIDLFDVEYMTPDMMWHPVNEVIDGQYTTAPTSDLSIEGIVLPYFPPVYHYVIYPNPPLEFGYQINATVTNQGDNDAGSFNVSFSVYLNETEIPEYGRKKTISVLGMGADETVWFYFMPENYGNYTLFIEADCDSDVLETDETNNVKTTWVIGTLRGDIDGDGDVDRHDFGEFAQVYGRRFEQPPYHPADFNYDGVVDRYDFGILAQNYAQSV